MDTLLSLVFQEGNKHVNVPAGESGPSRSLKTISLSPSGNTNLGGRLLFAATPPPNITANANITAIFFVVVVDAPNEVQLCLTRCLELDVTIDKFFLDNGSLVVVVTVGSFEVSRRSRRFSSTLVALVILFSLLGAFSESYSPVSSLLLLSHSRHRSRQAQDDESCVFRVR
jgi:hypothetical protein